MCTGIICDGALQWFSGFKVSSILTKRGNPAGTQEGQTILMAPEIYGYLGNKFGIHDIGGNGGRIYCAKQKRYCLNKDAYENPQFVNPCIFLLACISS